MSACGWLQATEVSDENSKNVLNHEDKERSKLFWSHIFLITKKKNKGHDFLIPWSILRKRKKKNITEFNILMQGSRAFTAGADRSFSVLRVKMTKSWWFCSALMLYNMLLVYYCFMMFYFLTISPADVQISSTVKLWDVEKGHVLRREFCRDVFLPPAKEHGDVGTQYIRPWVATIDHYSDTTIEIMTGLWPLTPWLPYDDLYHRPILAIATSSWWKNTWKKNRKFMKVSWISETHQQTYFYWAPWANQGTESTLLSTSCASDFQNTQIVT